MSRRDERSNSVGRLGISKVQVLDTRHPGLIQKVDAMFEAFASIQAVAAMIRAEYGERISLSSLEKYKSKHWRAQRELAEQMSAAQAASQGIGGEARLGLR